MKILEGLRLRYQNLRLGDPEVLYEDDDLEDLYIGEDDIFRPSSLLGGGDGGQSPSLLTPTSANGGGTAGEESDEELICSLLRHDDEDSGIISDDEGFNNGDEFQHHRFGGLKNANMRSIQRRNLQICFVNESADDSSEPEPLYGVNHNYQPNPESTGRLSVSRIPEEADEESEDEEEGMALMRRGKTRENLELEERKKMLGLTSSPSDANIRSPVFATIQQRLQWEAKMALAQAGHMAQMQMEVERQKKKKSSIGEKINLPDFCSGQRRLSRPVLSKLNGKQLMAIVKDFELQIQSLNQELVQHLVLRDDLHMQQDSMLVDIEDMSGFIREAVSGGPKSLPSFSSWGCQNNNNCVPLSESNKISPTRLALKSLRSLLSPSSAR